MARSKISAAIDGLLAYYSFLGHSERTLGPAQHPDGPAGLFGIIANMFASDKTDDTEAAVDPSLSRVARDLLLDVTEGGRFLTTIVDDTELISANRSTTGGLIRACYEETPGFTPGPGSTLIVGQADGAPGSGAVPPDMPFSAASVVAPVSSPKVDAASIYVTYEEGEGNQTTSDGFTYLKDPTINTNVSMPDKFTAPSLGAVVIDKLGCAFSTRHTDAVSLFMNGVPTIEMSRCAPFIDLRFVENKPGVSPEETGGILSGMTMLRFLGVYQVSAKSSAINFGLANALPANIKDPFALISAGAPTESLHSNVSTAGMELFTSPQTLVNPSINSGLLYSEEGATALNSREAAGLPPVVDPFQPFMTLKGMRLTQYGAGYGAESYVRGTISIRLHDRSRMPEITPLIEISAFAMTSMFLEFGWSHPDGENLIEPINPYATFLNSLRRREKIKLVAGSYTLLADGQVDIELDIGGVGGVMSSAIPVATGRYVPLSLVTSVINSSIDAELVKMQSKGKKVSPFSVTIAKSSSKNSGTTMIPKSVLIDSLALIKAAGAGEKGAPEKLAELIEKLIGKDGNTGELTAGERASSGTVLKEKIDGLRPKSSTPDPFLKDFTGIGLEGYPKFRSVTPVYTADEATELSDADVPGEPGAPYVSLGKVAMAMIGAPMAASHRFDEVQLLFYPFNAHAGAMHNQNVSSFPLSVKTICESLEGLAKDSECTIGQVGILLSRAIGDTESAPYGFSDLYQTSGEQSGETPVISKAMSERLHQMGAIFDSFKPPILKIYYEVVPTFSPDASNAEIKNKQYNKDICRIHIYDEAATPYVGAQQAIALSSKESISNVIASGIVSAAAVARSEAEGGDSGTGASDDLLKLIARDDLVQKIEASGVTDVDVYKIIASYSNLKSYVMSQVPSIIFGTAFSPVESVSIGGKTSGKQQTVFLERAMSQKKSDNPQSAGSGPLVGEVTVVPGTVSMTTLGCPVLSYGQQFFLDMQTGTTADNIYQIENLTHVLTEGGYKCEMALKWVGSATAQTIRGAMKQQLTAITEGQKATQT
jgi:hypothetical protein